MRNRKEKQYDDDDGRTIADMSSLSSGGGWKEHIAFKKKQEDDSGKEEKPWETSFTREERRMYAMGALKAAILIALVFIAGLGLVTAGLLALWT